jgi:hypothetical protein
MEILEEAKPTEDKDLIMEIPPIKLDIATANKVISIEVLTKDNNNKHDIKRKSK